MARTYTHTGIAADTASLLDGFDDTRDIMTQVHLLGTKTSCTELVDALNQYARKQGSLTAVIEALDELSENYEHPSEYRAKAQQFASELRRP